MIRLPLGGQEAASKEAGGNAKDTAGMKFESNLLVEVKGARGADLKASIPLDPAVFLVALLLSFCIPER